MNEQYRGFNLYSGCEPVSDTLRGQVTQWKPTGCIAFKHRTGLITELTRFQFPTTFDDETVVNWFGLEIVRILLDSSYRDFASRALRERDTADWRKSAPALRRPCD